MQLSIYELLKTANAIKVDEERSEYLRSVSSSPVTTVLQFGYDKNVVANLPKDIPAPYNPTVAVDVHGRLYSEARRLYIFCENNGMNMEPKKVQQLWVQLLESVHPQDAILLEHAKDKNITKLFPNLTPTFIMETFPGLISEPIEEVKKPVKGKKDEQI